MTICYVPSLWLTLTLNKFQIQQFPQKIINISNPSEKNVKKYIYIYYAQMK